MNLLLFLSKRLQIYKAFYLLQNYFNFFYKNFKVFLQLPNYQEQTLLQGDANLIEICIISIYFDWKVINKSVPNNYKNQTPEVTS